MAAARVLLLLMAAAIQAARAAPAFNAAPYMSLPPSPPAASGGTPYPSMTGGPVSVAFTPAGCTSNCVLTRGGSPYYVKCGLKLYKPRVLSRILRTKQAYMRPAMRAEGWLSPTHPISHLSPRTASTRSAHTRISLTRDR